VGFLFLRHFCAQWQTLGKYLIFWSIPAAVAHHSCYLGVRCDFYLFFDCADIQGKKNLSVYSKNETKLVGALTKIKLQQKTTISRRTLQQKQTCGRCETVCASVCVHACVCVRVCACVSVCVRVCGSSFFCVFALLRHCLRAIFFVPDVSLLITTSSSAINLCAPVFAFSSAMRFSTRGAWQAEFPEPPRATRVTSEVT